MLKICIILRSSKDLFNDSFFKSENMSEMFSTKITFLNCHRMIVSYLHIVKQLEKSYYYIFWTQIICQSANSYEIIRILQKTFEYHGNFLLFVLEMPSFDAKTRKKKFNLLPQWKERSETLQQYFFANIRVKCFNAIFIYNV